jgi:hypothetical protein
VGEVVVPLKRPVANLAVGALTNLGLGGLFLYRSFQPSFASSSSVWRLLTAVRPIAGVWPIPAFLGGALVWLAVVLVILTVRYLRIEPFELRLGDTLEFPRMSVSGELTVKLPVAEIEEIRVLAGGNIHILAVPKRRYVILAAWLGGKTEAARVVEELRVLVEGGR